MEVIGRMTDQQRAEIKCAIAFYDARGWDWSDLVTFLCLKFSNLRGVPR